jgi:molecular chaperone GrpE
MTKENKGKRRIEIEDKRGRQDEAAAPGAEPPPVEDQAAMDEKLLKLADAIAEGQAEEASPAGGDQAGPAAADSTAEYPPLAEGDVPWPQRAMEYLELARRKEAELQNYRKRAYKDLDSARRAAVEALLADLFPALDGLAQAVRSYADTPEGESPLVDGVRRTVKVLEAAFSKHGIERINAAPVPFNPELHQALNVEQSDEVTADTVAEVYVDGYRLGDTVLKPAMVRVVKPG